MLLTQLVNKEIFSGSVRKGYFRGVGISLKSYAVKYLLCSVAPSAEADFAVPTTAVEEVGESVVLKRLRPVFPKNCARIFIGRPVYSVDGVYLGCVADLALQNFTAAYLYTDRGESYPVTAIAACLDAVLLKKEQPYPLGQRLPEPIRYELTDKQDALVTRQILRAAIEQGSLIRLTLSLPPFA